MQSLPQSLHIAITRSNLGAPVFVALVLVHCPHLRRLLRPVLPVHVGARPSETSDDNLFQAAGPEKLNPRSTNLVLVQCLTYLAVLAERKPDLLLAEVTD